MGGYEPPNFCDACGNPHPWASREARFFELENLLDREDLDPADRLRVQHELDAIRSSDETQEEELERWRRIRNLAPSLLLTGQRIAESVMTAYVKAHMGL